MSTINIVWAVIIPMLFLSLVCVAISALNFFNAVVDAHNARIVSKMHCKPVAVDTYEKRVVDAGEKPDDEFEAIIWRLKVEGR